ncbi:MAG: hypothetical protein RI883_1686 [Bacteroidota bacterium]|jgi:phosphatidylinositol glycan class B
MLRNILFTFLNFHRKVFFFAVIIYSITAYNSNGFFHADEHYQIIEFAGIKSGTHTISDLAWEYKEAIRPAIQPTLCYGLFSVLNTIDVTDPYSQTFILRLLSGFLALGIIYFFVEKTKNKITEKFRKAYFFLSYFLWFIPFLSVRFTSETWSGLMLLLALGIYFKQQKETFSPLLIGIVLGFSFLFRFQSAFFILPILLWLLAIERKSIMYIIKVTASILLIILFGIAIDSWFYERLVFTAYNYFYQNIVLDVASTFGTDPWNFYLIQLKNLPSLFIGIPLIAAIVFLFFKSPKNIFVWCIISYITFHSLIPHKEDRFIFPIAFLFPIVLIMAYQEIIKFINQRKTIITLFNYVFGLLFISINGLGLFILAQKPAGLGRMEITKYIHEKYNNKSIHLMTCIYSNPYNPWGLPMKFYTEKNMIQTSQLNSIADMNDTLFVKNADNIIVIRKVDLSDIDCQKALDKYHFKLVKKSMPDWMEKVNSYYHGMENSDVFLIYDQD